ncbi:hypothetical protein DP939_22015 [Spongiactinospora rosea]|uniref:Uncharacterized protein n=1 Tax=Spongiactinospora rosea TaxID=2248750 RepID=A0A366LVS3_9ACTN|nr:hypothetical protein [Spongiactinospora rosea]RBQ18046.1 hypothetical protein DP939_22015 [Spongiactinospora rosea]
MAAKLRSFRDDVSTDYGSFQLIDMYGGEVEAASMTDGILHIHTGMLSVGTAVSHGTIDVRLESWDAAPPPAPDPWVAAGEVGYASGGGILNVIEDEGEGSLDAFVLGPPYFRYGVRAYHVPPARSSDGDFWEDPRRAHVLLCFWPLLDVFDPGVHALPETVRAERAAPRPSGYVPSMDWPVLRERTAPPPPDEPEPDVTNDPYPWRTLAEHRVRTHIRHDLDPEGAPVFSVDRGDLITFGPPEPGTSHRVTTPAPAIVTVLATDGDLLTVRHATVTESARVLATERAWADVLARP